ncbi:MAG: hypothetical protein KDC24_08490 [Saprospiraceae bacterium]|nr:hypothetical protein [Saprospiraceae bacterium]
MKIIPLTILICILLGLSLQAQVSGISLPNSKTGLEEKLALKVEYFGELVLHPGLSVGIEYTLSKNNWNTLHWNTDLGGFWHRWNNTAVFLKTSVGSRIATGPVFADINLGIGYMHSWAAGDLYQSDGNGGVEKATNWGHAHFMPNASLLFGWDGSVKTNLPWAVHLGPEVYLQSSFNHIFLPHIAAKIGFTYKLK